jgi:uncharacterized protein (TIGR00297 family)
MLDKQGIMLGLAMGLIVFLTAGLNYLALVIVFFALAVLATKYQHYQKRELGIYEHERSWENVFYNGAIPMIFAVLSPQLGPMPFIASISAITADKFASELGVLSGQPIDLGTLKPAKPGTSGAVSILGFVMSLAGGTLIGVAGMWAFGLTPNTAALIGIAGFIGSLVDSIFGIFEERGFGTKGTTNLICAISGGIVGLFI